MLIAISGGIGSGKSVVARILHTLGYTIYDCDSRARQLMDSSQTIKEAISRQIGSDCVTVDGRIDRVAVGKIVFNNAEKLATLNAITHAAVREDIDRWYRGQESELVFVETAILYQSKIDKMVNAVIDVTAPVNIRINRVMQRNDLEYQEVVSRIEAQKFNVESYHPHTFTLVNDGLCAVFPQLISIINTLKKMA